MAGTEGRSLRMEALRIKTLGVGGICAQAHVEQNGWHPVKCGKDLEVIEVGTTGQSLRMEALSLSRNVSSGWQRVCANAHLQSIGWQGWRCGVDGVVVGTTGESRRMEAVMILIT